jgi:signal transduction histidine kinase
MSSSPRARTPLRRRLLLLVGAALLPLAVASAIGLVLLAREKRAQVARGALDTMRAMAVAVDLELSRAITALQTLSASSPLDRDDLVAFHDEARRALALQPAWLTVTLADAEGQQVLNLLRPPGAPLPRVVEMASFQAALRTGRPVAGNMTLGPLTQEQHFTVRVPIVRADTPRYVASLAIKPDSMLRLIDRQRIPAEWVVSILDAHGLHVARSRRHEEFVARPPGDAMARLLAAAVTQPEGWGRSTTSEGDAVYAAYSRSHKTGWTVAVGIPAAVVDGAVLRSSLLLGTGAFLSLALGGAAAALVARHVTRPIGALRGAAQAVGRGETPSVPPSPIAELDEVADALTAAAAARRQAAAEREALLHREQQARALAEEASRAKDEFLAMLGHELRNPLGAVATAVRVLERTAEAGPGAARARAIIARQVEHLGRLVDDLLDVGRVMTGKILLERAPLDLAAATASALAALRAGARTDGHAVRTALAPVWVEADVTRIEQIVVNLVGNAIKYTAAGGTITVSTRREDAHAVLEVADSGIGMAPDLVPRIFDLFVQGARGLDRAQGGLGIGLTLVRRLAELHGGSVSAASPGEGKGSVFTVRLPAVTAPVATTSGAVPGAAPGPRRVLVVEDHDDAREMLVHLLRLDGHEAHEARDGREALEAARRLRLDAALVDIGLPGLDGYEVARRLRAAPDTAGLLLVAVTGYGLPEDRDRSQVAGFDEHLVKPVTADALARALAARPGR